MNNYKIAMIGCGRIGILLENDPLRYKPSTHYGGLTEAGLKVTYASDINKERLEEFASIALIEKDNLYENYKLLLEERQPEIVIITTWTKSHIEIGTYAAKNNAKIIVLEKPIGGNLKSIEKFLNICKKNKIKLFINHERRYDSRYKKTKELLESNKIGKIKTVFASILSHGENKGICDIKDGGGPLIHDGTHMVDIIRFFFGEISHLTGEIEKNKFGFENRAIAWLKSANNIDIILEAGGKRKYFVFELIISGTDGKIIIGNGYEKLFLNKKSKYYSGFKDLVEVPFPSFKKNNSFTALYEEVNQLIEGEKIAITSSGLDGYKAVEIIHSIYKSAHLNKKINLPIKPSSINLDKIFDLKKIGNLNENY